jgi:acyl-CoA synthetase (AMP-forming)/AMP-acid ligase II
MGLKRGDVVALNAPNHIDYPVVLFAGNRNGLVLTTANPEYLPHEFAHQLKDSDAKIIFTHNFVFEECKEAAKLAGIDSSNIFVLGTDSSKAKSLSMLISKGKGRKVKINPLTIEQLRNHPAYLCYSSGTTGRSKGVISSNLNMIANIHQHQVYRVSDDHVVQIAVLPFYHIYGLMLFLHIGFGRARIYSTGSSSSSRCCCHS